MLTAPGPLMVNVGEFTVSETVVEAVSVPEVPLMVTVFVPTATVLLAVKVSVLLLVAGFGEKVAVTPLGSPETDEFTFPLNP